jgi:hypothetical protein
MGNRLSPVVCLLQLGQALRIALEGITTHLCKSRPENESETDHDVMEKISTEFANSQSSFTNYVGFYVAVADPSIGYE